jgi:signal recognition particle GTPase
VPGSYQLRQQEQHEQKLREIREQVDQGKLVIRQMTPEERKRFPPRAASPRNARGKRR